MIDETGRVAAHCSFSNPPPVDLEAPDVTTLHVALLAPEAFLMRDFLAGIVDDAFVLRNMLRRKDAPTVKLRTATCDHGSSPPPPRLRRVSPKRNAKAESQSAASLCQFATN